MAPDAKQQLLRTGDWSREAMQARLTASLEAAGMNKASLARAIGVTPSGIGNMTTGMNHPSPEAMRYLFEHHDIDPTFIMSGRYSRLPVDVLERICAAMLSQRKAPGRREGSG